MATGGETDRPRADEEADAKERLRRTLEHLVADEELMEEAEEEVARRIEQARRSADDAAR